MKPWKKIIPNNRGASIGFILLPIALIAGGYWYKTSQTQPVAELPGVAKEMRDKPDPWMTLEKDGGVLLSDLKEDKIASAGLAADAVLVSTRSGDKYHVKDLRGYFGDKVTTELAKHPTFQLAVLRQTPLFGESRLLVYLRETLLVCTPMLLLAAIGVALFRGELIKGARLTDGEAPDTRFKDVVGASEAKEALRDIVNYLRNPQSFADLGVRPPKGVLMLGGPGVGKTMLAKALAGESGARFIATSGSDFSSKFYGVGIMKVKHLFTQARKCAPCVLFIDEMDGISSRSSVSDAASSEMNRIINQMLIEMDGFASNSGVIVVGATNLPENLDPAFLREGRIDRRITIKLPDVREREELLMLCASRLSLEAGIDFPLLARMTSGLSPATIDYVVNSAGLRMARDGRCKVNMADLTEAVEAAHIGEVNGAKGRISDAERRRIAVHEAGHAIVAAVLEVGKLEKVTMLARGNALGATYVTPDDDKTLHAKSDLEHRIQLLLGGRNAEHALCEEASSGAAHDLKEASRIALDMVGRYGFDENGSLFSFESLPRNSPVHETSELIRRANEVLRRIDQDCRLLLEKHAAALASLTDELLEKETVPGARVQELIELHSPRMLAVANS